MKVSQKTYYSHTERLLHCILNQNGREKKANITISEQEWLNIIKFRSLERISMEKHDETFYYL